MKKRHRHGLAAVGLASLILGGLAAADRLFPPDLGRLVGRSVVVVDRDGQLLRPFPTEQDTWRLPTRVDTVDPRYVSLLVMAEDRRFGLHPGIDPLAVIRAAGQGLRHGRVVSGASTLTMQVARLLNPRPRTLGAKLAESLRALQLQWRLGRSGVLDAYLTLAPFGGTLEGAEAAAQSWFGKSPRQLTLAEAALLVALPQSPERLRPDRHPKAAKAARDRILDRAVQRGVISADMAAAAQAEPVPVIQRPLPMLAPHLAEYLARTAAPGAVIRTHIDPSLQRALERLGQNELAKMNVPGDLAVVILSNHGHRLLAHLGSGQWIRRQVDLSRAVRSPGSTLKPFIYGVAFDDLSLHPYTLVDDLPQRFGAWMPNNFDQDFHGTMTVREALQRSLNIPAVLALDKVGPARMAALLSQAGLKLRFPPSGDPGLPLALGGVGITLMDLTNLYAALANDGQTKAMDISPDYPAPPSQSRLIQAPAARVILDILEGSPAPDGIALGTAVTRTRHIAFKTGTSYGYRDAWTIGVSADYTVGVWVGRADGMPRPGTQGRTTAAPIMFSIFGLLPPDHGRWSPPPGDHALFRRPPPPALARLTGPDDPVQRRAGEKIRILFPPAGATVETVDQGIALSARGGTPPLQWVADGLPLPAGTTFWQPPGEGFARLAVVDAMGQRDMVTIRIVNPSAGQP